MRSIGTGATWRIGCMLAMAVALGGCGTSVLNSSTNIFSGSKSATDSPGTAGVGAVPAANDDIECPGITVRPGAATMMIGSKPGAGEPSALDLRYQGTIVRTARECRVAAGVMTMKIGIEGRVITGPAGAPGTVDIPLRIAVVHEGVNPKTINTKLVRLQATITNAIDRVTFQHIEPELTYPMPVPPGDIDSYVVYVGFDPQTPPERKPARPPRGAKPQR